LPKAAGTLFEEAEVYFTGNIEYNITTFYATTSRTLVKRVRSRGWMPKLLRKTWWSHGCNASDNNNLYSKR